MKLKETNQYKKSKMAVPAVILYIVAILFAIITLFAIYNTSVYIKGLVSQGLVIKDSLVDVINFYFKECSQYGAFTVIFAIGGVAIQKIYDCKAILGELEVEEEIINGEVNAGAETIEEVNNEESTDIMEEDNTTEDK